MHDIHTMSFWIANLSQLLYYLKKDTGLVVATAEHQLEISELISETYSFLVSDSEKRLDRILESAMIEYEQLGGLEPVHFVDEWQRFFRRGRTSTSRRSMMLEKEPPLSPRALAPQSVASLLTSTLYVLQSYEVHPVIVIQAIAQLFHYISCEIFNRILVNKKYLCRSKALQIRMNLTVLEEWVREHQLPSTLSAYFDPVIQLVQLLQCVSQLSDLMDFINTTKAFDLLNPMQVRRLILNYRYEVNEPKLPEEIEKYTMQIAEDTLKSIQKIPRQSTDSLTIRTSVSRPNSMSSLGSLLYNINGNKKQQQRLSFQSTVSSIESTAEDELEEERELLVEKRDSKYMLPFSLPTTTNMLQKGWSRNTAPRNKEGMSLSDQIYFELKQKLSYERERDARERSVIPNIPETWLERLDHHAGLY
jgi:hypothetical protein